MTTAAEARALVPKLRFPEFLKAEEWRWTLLGQLFSERREMGFPNLPLLSLMNKEGIVPQEDTNRKNNSSADKSKYLRVVPGDIAYNTMRMWEGRSAYVGIEGVISPAYTVCTPATKVNGIFFSYYFKTESLIRQFRKFSQGIVKDTLNLKYKSFSQVQTLYPEKEQEQQKIADCLTSIDELITLESQKLDTLKRHKKGLMQQLFPRKGETVPHLRFPEFQGTNEWDINGLGTLTTFVNEKISIVQISLENYISTENILQDYGGITKASKLPETGSVTQFRSNDILFSNIRPYLKKVWLADKKGGASNDVIVIHAKQEIEAKFLSFLLKNDTFINYVMTGAKGVKMPRGDIESIKKYPTPFPLRAEQQKIAECLASIDDCITAQNQKIETLKTHKKGLMQQLFPAPDGFSAAQAGKT